MHPLFSPDTARDFAAEWITTWNSRDLEGILKHYSAEIELHSPFVSRLMEYDNSAIHGIAVLRVYFARALNAYPDLCFKLQHVYVGVQSLVVEYESVGGRMAAEMLEFDSAGLISRVYAHYSRLM